MASASSPARPGTPVEAGWVLSGRDGSGRPVRLVFGDTELSQVYLGIVIGDAPAHAHRQGQTLGLAEQFRRSSPGQRSPRTVSVIYTGQSLALRPFFERLAAAGGGDLSDHQGQMIESVLLSVLKDA